MDSNSRFGGRRSERRKAQRDPMGFPVSLHSISQSRVALLLDVSSTGARFGGLNLPAVGKDILLKIAGVEMFGTVVRARGEEAAMRFDRALGESELDKLRAAIADHAPNAQEATIEVRAKGGGDSAGEDGEGEAGE